jgi:hypothetical protein
VTDSNEQDTPAEDSAAPKQVDLSEITGSRLTPLVVEAIELHEYFRAFMAGGFTEDQALRIVSNMFGSVTNVVTIIPFDGEDLDEDYDDDF